MRVEYYHKWLKSIQFSKKKFREIDAHADFILGNFEDTYENLIYKTHAAYNFIDEVSKNCETDFQRVIFHDDDTFVDDLKMTDYSDGIICGVSSG